MEQVALLFTDIEGSTGLIERSASGYSANLRCHHDILRSKVREFGGTEFLDVGDGLCFAFSESDSAARAGLAIQSALQSVEWPEANLPLSVRLALHWATAEFREGQYRGAGIHLISRVLAAAHGGQILASAAFVGKHSNRAAGQFIPLGTYRLKGFQSGEAIFQLTSGENSPRLFPALRADRVRQPNLPPSPGTFFGRQDELATLAQWLNDPENRVVTITGTGGSGKSRLSLFAAEQLLELFDHGVYYVPLADISDAAAIPHAILAALGETQPDSTSPIARLQEALAGPRTMVVLDNFEQFSASGAAMMNQLLENLEHTCFLVTSRARIGIPAEREMALTAFPLPAPNQKREDVLEQFACVQFFLNRAGKVAPGRVFKGEELSEIAEICRLVDGLPLALDLVAARISALTTGELKDQLIQGLGHSDSTTQGQLEKTLDWSLRLLPPPVARLLETLAVFRGGWTVQSASAVSGLSETLAQSYLHYLLVCSLIQAQVQAEQMRFNLLIPLREFAEARLGARRGAIYRRHIYFFRDLVQRASDAEHTEEGRRLCEIVEVEVENVLVGLRREKNAEKRVADVVNVHSMLMYGIYNRPLRKILIDGIPKIRRSTPYRRAVNWHTVATLDSNFGEDLTAYKYFRRAANTFAKCGKLDAANAVKFNLVAVTKRLGKSTEELEIYQEGLAYYHSAGNKHACATILHSIARYHFGQKYFNMARTRYEECIEMSKEAHSFSNLAAALCGLGETLVELGQPAAAVPMLVESLEWKLKIGKHLSIPHSFFALAKAALIQGRPESAAILYGIAADHQKANQVKLSNEYNAYVEAIISTVRSVLGATLFQERMDYGAKLPHSEWLQFIASDFLHKNRKLHEARA